MADEPKFYLTEWKPEGDGEGRKLMEREGADDGGDAIVAEFSRYPVPLGEQLAATALAAANTHQERVTALAHERATQRAAKLRAMSDEDAVKAALMNMADSIRWRDTELPKFMRDLENAGFCRPTDISDAVLDTVDRVLRVIIALDRPAGPYPHELPGLRNELYFALDRLTGENHSGNSTSLPPPPRRLVGREAIRALRDELARGVAAPTWSTGA